MPMNKTTGYDSCSGDCSCLVQYARRGDGAWFFRIQGRHPRYGYQWGRWRPTVEQESYRLRPVSWRLPKDAR